MRQWLTLITISIALAQLSWAQPSPLSIQWLSNGAPPNTDSRFPSISADGTRVVFQVGNGRDAEIWEWQQGQSQAQSVKDPQGNPIKGIHPVISADGNHIAFASVQDYGFGSNNKWQIYVLDRLQNRIVPISFLWRDTNGDGMRDTDNFEPSNGNCVPVAISADGRIVVFLAQSPNALNIVDADGDGTSDPVNNPPSDWLVLIHDRDADGNGVYDEAGIGATRTFVGSLDFVPSDPTNPFPVPAASISVSANGRIIAFATPDPDPNNPDNPDENWRVIVRDWQNGDQVEIPNAFAPALSDDGTYLAYLQPTAALNEPSPTYLQSKMNLVVQRIERNPNTGSLTLGPSLSLTDLTLPAQSGTADGSAGWGYSDWWGAVTIAVDPRDPNVVYAAFHAWSTDLVDLSLVRSDLVVDGNANTPRLKFYQGVPNIFLARFDFTNIDTNPQAPQLWRLTEWTDQQQADKRRGLPVSLEPPVGQQTQYRLTLAPSLLPAVSFVNGNRLAIVFQSLMGWDKDGDGQVGEDPVDGRDNDGDGKIDEDPPNGLWDIYLADVLLP